MILDSGRINASNIANQSFANLYNLINNRSNVPDPNDTTGRRKFVHVREPNKGRGFGRTGFPFIIVSRSKPKKGDSTADYTQSFMSYDFSIRVVCRDSDSDSQGNAIGSEQCALITDSIIKTLNNADKRKTLNDQRMPHLEFDVEPDEDEFEGKSVFISDFDIRFGEGLTLTT